MTAFVENDVHGVTRRFLMDWDQYRPIVKLLEAFGATNDDGEVEKDADAIELQAREWQSRKVAKSI